jgi:hypothetical protein
MSRFATCAVLALLAVAAAPAAAQMDLGDLLGGLGVRSVFGRKNNQNLTLFSCVVTSRRRERERGRPGRLLCVCNQSLTHTYHLSLSLL